MTDLEKAADQCNDSQIQVADAGRTLIIDHQGEDESTGVSFDKVVCVLGKLAVPASVTARMDSTRALDGVQSGDWDGYTATWSYHPDSGMDLIIEAAS